MKEFKTLEELQNNEQLQKMSRYSYEKVKLAGEEVFACTTNQQYEDIIWGSVCEMFHRLFEHFNIEYTGGDFGDWSSDIRDKVLELLEENGIKFVDVFDEY